jgi:hypothetical protein
MVNMFDKIGVMLLSTTLAFLPTTVTAEAATSGLATDNRILIRQQLG